MQTRPTVVSGNPDIFSRAGQQFFRQLTNQSGIDAGEFVDLLTDTLEIIVIPGSSPVGFASLTG
jgi:uncharacterized protein YidB (DUF937 family)